jgi:hypothetical protein
MKVFVDRSELTLTANEAVRVLGYYEDHVAVSPTAHGDRATILFVGPGAVINANNQGPALPPGWRDANRTQLAYGEAERRILEAFPDYSQRNASAELMGYLSVHGATVSGWPAAAQKRKGEIDRAWSYVEAVRRAANGMLAGGMPANPTADSHWPTRISPYRSV